MKTSDKGAQRAMTDTLKPKPIWAAVEYEPGKWRVEKDGKVYNAGPWPTEAAAQDALGYFAWCAAGGSPD